jgi:hypothetical protein
MTKEKKKAARKTVVGWREWVGMPELEIRAIKAKLDTGALSAALHAEEIEVFEEEGVKRVRFKVLPRQKSARGAKLHVADVIDERVVRSSSGHEELRPVISTEIALGLYTWRVEMTLTNRDAMGFRLLLGRDSLRRRFLIDPGRSYLFGDQE